MIDFDEIYKDQAIHGISVPGFHFLSAYTPEGIRKLDTLFSRRVMAFKNEESYTEYSYNYSECRYGKPPKKEVERIWTDTFETLSEDIQNNPHLHPIIKENLMFNLNNCERSNSKRKKPSRT